MYEVSYRADGTIEAVRPLDGAPSRVRKRIIADMDAVYFPEYFVVPFLDIVHDRAMSEIFRGCIRLLDWAEKEHTNISLPSLRVDGFSEELANQLNVLRRSGLTFAPEAGTQRLRDAINKNVTEEEILETSRKAFAGGWTAVKLYFMMGLPTETLEDIEGIARLGQQIVNLYYANPDKPKGKGVTVSISASCFVP